VAQWGGVVAQLGQRGSSMGRRGSSIGEAWWLNGEEWLLNWGGVVAQWGGVVAQLGQRGSSMGRRGSSIGEAWWLNGEAWLLNWGGVVAQWGGVVAQLGQRGSSMGRRGGSMGRHGGSMVACHTVVLLSRVRVQHLPRRNLTANLLVGCYLGWHLAKADLCEGQQRRKLRKMNRWFAKKNKEKKIFPLSVKISGNNSFKKITALHVCSSLRFASQLPLPGSHPDFQNVPSVLSICI
jgi:hypothetical protein